MLVALSFLLNFDVENIIARYLPMNIIDKLFNFLVLDLYINTLNELVKESPEVCLMCISMFVCVYLSS